MRTTNEEVAQLSAIGGEAPTDLANETLLVSRPSMLRITVEGVSDILFHRYCVEAVDAKSAAPKGSRSKKEDNIESYVYRNNNRELCIPGEYFRQAVINAAKFQQDPRSPRKSAMDLFKAGVIGLTDLASLGITRWDYEDRRRVLVQRSAVTRTRPAVLKGWRATFDLMITIPEYIDRTRLMQAVTDAGRLVGLGDFRPTYGRFVVVTFTDLINE